MVPELILEPGRAEKNYWRDLWRYRELFYFLAWRDILVRYKQTVIGIAWAVDPPLADDGGVHLCVQPGGQALRSGHCALHAARDGRHAPLAVLLHLPERIQQQPGQQRQPDLQDLFPAPDRPRQLGDHRLVDFLITLGLMAVLMLWYGFLPDWHIVLLPLFILLAFGASFGVGLWLCALNVEYRDFRYIVPFIVQFGLYISPVGFSSTIVPDKWHLLYSLNPMVGVIDGFRWCLLRGADHARRLRRADVARSPSRFCSSAASGTSARWSAPSPT